MTTIISRNRASVCRMPVAPMALKVGKASTSRIDEAIGEGRWREYGQPAVFAYCEEDVSKSTELFRAQLAGYRHYAPVDPQLVMRWSEYSAKSVARVQAAGMPIDMPLWNLVQENKWTIARALIARLDPSQGSEDPIYNIDADGSCDWSPGGLRNGSRASTSPIGQGWIPVNFRSTATPSRSCTACARRPIRIWAGRSRKSTLYATALASSFVLEFRSVPTAAIVRACFRLAPRPDVTRMPSRSITPTPACALS